MYLFLKPKITPKLLHCLFDERLEKIWEKKVLANVVKEATKAYLLGEEEMRGAAKNQFPPCCFFPKISAKNKQSFSLHWAKVTFGPLPRSAKWVVGTFFGQRRRLCKSGE